jgi:leucyl-tRNA synthetase
MAEENEVRYDPAAIEPKGQQRWAADPTLLCGGNCRRLEA